MTFKEKIDSLLTLNELGVNSVYALEQLIGASTGAVNKYYNKDTEPGVGTIKKIKKAFGLTDQAWKAGDFGKKKEVSGKNLEPEEGMTLKLIDTLERVVESKNQEIGWLRKHIDDLTVRSGSMKEAQ